MTTRIHGLGSALALLAVLGACSSVQVPEQHLYRLRLPDPPRAVETRRCVLRIGPLDLAADLGGDRLVVADGPVKVAHYRNHRWAGPLERLVADALLAGIARSRAFEQVKSDSERGGEDLLLTGRVLDFHQSVRDGRWVGDVALDVRIAAQDGGSVLHVELRRDAELESAEPEALVLALSSALEQVVDDLLGACVEAGLAAPPAVPRPGAGTR